MIGKEEIKHVLTMWHVYISKTWEPTPEELDLMHRDCQKAPNGPTLMEWIEEWCLLNQGRGMVNWGHFAKFLREKTSERRRAADAAHTPSERCYYCQDTGWFPVVCPTSPLDGTLMLSAEDFYPPTPWKASPVYRFVVGCLCSKGQKHSISEPWRRLRAKHREWYDAETRDPVSMLSAYEIACREVHDGPVDGGIDMSGFRRMVDVGRRTGSTQESREALEDGWPDD